MTTKTNLPVKVAYADDHEMMRAGLCNLLNNRNKVQVVIDARNGLELVQKLEAQKEPPDLVILDIFMPYMDGFETMKALRKKWPEIKVLVLTGHNTDYYHVKMIMEGANGYMLKTSGPSEIEAAILEIHETGEYYSDRGNAKFIKAVTRGDAVIPTLSEKEATFMKLCCGDLSYGRIAEEMGITIAATDWLRDKLFKRFKVQNRPGLVSCGLRYGLIPSSLTEATDDKQDSH